MSGTEFGKYLRLELEKRGLNPTEFSKISGIPRTSVASMLSGKLTPGPKVWAKIQAALQLPPEDEHRLWVEASEGSQRIAAIQGFLNALPVPPINVLHPAIAGLLADHFGEEVGTIHRVTEILLEFGKKAPGEFRDTSQILATVLRSYGEALRNGQITGEADEERPYFDAYMACPSGAIIGVAVRGLLLTAARCGEGGVLPPCLPVEIMKSGGVVFRLAVLTNPDELPEKLENWRSWKTRMEVYGEELPT